VSSSLPLSSLIRLLSRFYSLTNAFDVFEHADSTPPPVVPALHVLYTLPSPSPLPTSSEITRADAETLRSEIIEYLASELDGDLEAAEWLLLALIARMYGHPFASPFSPFPHQLTSVLLLSHTRHATGLALGSLSLNLSFPTHSPSSSVSSSFTALLSSLVPALAPLSPTISSLNDPETCFSPRSRDESLDAGSLQLRSGTNVLVDLRGLGEGKLNDTGSLSSPLSSLEITDLMYGKW